MLFEGRLALLRKMLPQIALGQSPCAGNEAKALQLSHQKTWPGQDLQGLTGTGSPLPHLLYSSPHLICFSHTSFPTVLRASSYITSSSKYALGQPLSSKRSLPGEPYLKLHALTHHAASLSLTGTFHNLSPALSLSP